MRRFFRLGVERYKRASAASETRIPDLLEVMTERVKHGDIEHMLVAYVWIDDDGKRRVAYQQAGPYEGFMIRGMLSHISSLIRC